MWESGASSRPKTAEGNGAPWTLIFDLFLRRERGEREREKKKNKKKKKKEEGWEYYSRAAGRQEDRQAGRPIE